MNQATWKFDNLERIGSYDVAVCGDPKIVNAPGGKAVKFNGVDDGLTLDTHPFETAEAFTVELVFRPDADGLPEQRFFHIQESDSENRILVETRLTGKGQWYLDTYIASGKTDETLIDPSQLHPVGQWYHVALVFDGCQMRHYVNGTQELSAVVPEFQPPHAGKTSIGVRLNKVCWFKGAMQTARLSRFAVEPKDFLRVG